MEHHHHLNQKRYDQTTSSSSSSTSTSRRSLKRKLDEDFEDNTNNNNNSIESHDLALKVRAQVVILDSTFSQIESDRAAAKRAIHFLSQLAKNEEEVNLIVDCGAVPALVRHLKAPPPVREGGHAPMPYEHEVEKGSAFTLGLLAIKVCSRHFTLHVHVCVLHWQASLNCSLLLLKGQCITISCW
ncbi:hypothetical protein Leryth_004918 [Lithospermum erythrorhizon]|nr:hypothetical protein Leryth_004918 [Lithospermum erythrorhizon]